MLAALILHIRRPATAQIKIYVNTDLEGIKGLSREAAVLYPFEETRKALYEGAKRAVSLITKCKPYRIEMPVKVKMQQLKTDPGSGLQEPVTFEWISEDAIHILNPK